MHGSWMDAWKHTSPINGTGGRDGWLRAQDGVGILLFGFYGLLVLHRVTLEKDVREWMDGLMIGLRA